MGGNAFFASHFSSLKIMATKYEPIPHATHLLGSGDVFQLGTLSIEVLATPCHTKGHVVYLVTGKEGTSPILFTGDTLFVGGCGRFFEGTASDMLANMDLFAKMPPDTTFYCAHEYTESNYKFLNHVDPELCGERYQEIAKLRQNKLPTVPSKIENELKTNLFMRCRDERTQRLVGAMGSPVETMGMLRKMKNDF